MKPDPAAPRVEQCPTCGSPIVLITARQSQNITYEFPLEDGRQEFEPNEFVNEFWRENGHETLQFSALVQMALKAFSQGWTARAARERELRKDLEVLEQTWDLFHSALPDGEYKGLGALRLTLRVIFKRAALTEDSNVR